MRATYTGITPDTFVNDSEVVLTGTLAPDGFHATNMTVCAHRSTSRGQSAQREPQDRPQLREG